MITPGYLQGIVSPHLEEIVYEAAKLSAHSAYEIDYALLRYTGLGEEMKSQHRAGKVA
jgi:hypothetical protein